MAQSRAASTTGIAEVVPVFFADLPPLSPTRRPTECSRPRLSRSTPCCMATPQASAAEAEANTTMSPSPRFFTSVPPAWAMPGVGSRNARGEPRRPASGESRCDSSVEPTTSVNRIATFSVVKTDSSRLGRHRVVERQIVPLRRPGTQLLALRRPLRPHHWGDRRPFLESPKISRIADHY